MLKELLKLYFKQERRNFSWKDVFIALYLGVLMISTGVGFYFGIDGDVNKLTGGKPIDAIAIYLILFVIPMDLIVKFFIKQEAPVMDDYLRSRPVSMRAWNRFLLVLNAFQFWTWVTPVLLGLFLFVVMSPGVALMGTIACYAMSLNGAMMATCYKKARGWELKMSFGAVPWLFFFGSLCFAVFTSFVGYSRIPGLQLLYYTVLNLLSVGVFYLAICGMNPYDEHHQKVSKVRSLGHVSLFRMDFISLWRAKRLRQMVVFLIGIMVLCLYSHLLTGDAKVEAVGDMYVYYVIGMPSLLLAQWVFGVEANYFHGLWTKPVDIAQVLQTKFYSFALLNLFGAVMVVPYVLMGGTDAFSVMACLVFVQGFQNLMGMPTCLVSERVDIFSSAFFNYQGSSMKLNLWGMILLIPFGLCLGLPYLLPKTASNCILLALGILGWAGHRPCIRYIATLFVKRRHGRFEAYNK